MDKAKSYNQQLVYGLMSTLSVQQNIIALPIFLVEFTGDITSALFLAQCLYYSGIKGGNKEYGFWKSAKEWKEETGLSEKQVSRSFKICSKWVQKSVHMAMVKRDNKPTAWGPTNYYTVDMDSLLDDLEKFFAKKDAEQANQRENFNEKGGYHPKGGIDTAQRVVSITEKTTKTNNDLAKRDLKISIPARDIDLKVTKDGSDIEATIIPKFQSFVDLLQETENMPISLTEGEIVLFKKNASRAVDFLLEDIVKGETGRHLAKHVYNQILNKCDTDAEIIKRKKAEKRLRKLIASAASSGDILSYEERLQILNEQYVADNGQYPGDWFTNPKYRTLPVKWRS